MISLVDMASRAGTSVEQLRGILAGMGVAANGHGRSEEAAIERAVAKLVKSRHGAAPEPVGAQVPPAVPPLPVVTASDVSRTLPPVAAPPAPVPAVPARKFDALAIMSALTEAAGERAADQLAYARQAIIDKLDRDGFLPRDGVSA